MSQKQAKLQEVQARRHSFTNPSFQPSEQDPVPEVQLSGGDTADAFQGTESFYDDVGPNVVLEDDGTYDNEGPQERRAPDPRVSEDHATYDFLPSDESDDDSSVDDANAFQGFTPAETAAQTAARTGAGIDGYMNAEQPNAAAGYVAVEASHVGGLTAAAGYVAVEASTVHGYDELSEEEEI